MAVFWNQSCVVTCSDKDEGHIGQVMEPSIAACCSRGFSLTDFSPLHCSAWRKGFSTFCIPSVVKPVFTDILISESMGPRHVRYSFSLLYLLWLAVLFVAFLLRVSLEVQVPLGGMAPQVLG